MFFPGKRSYEGLCQVHKLEELYVRRVMLNLQLYLLILYLTFELSFMLFILFSVSVGLFDVWMSHWKG